MKESNHTFIIPAYKDSKFIEDCILSIKRQTIPSKILITTSTPSPFLSEIAKRHDVEVETHKTGSSIAKDWNFAYNSCKTKYLTLAHQDDIYLPGYTEQCLILAEKKSNNHHLIVFTNYSEYKINQLRAFSAVLLVKRILLGMFLFKNNISSRILKKCILSFGNPISCPSVMFNTENIGPFAFSEEYNYNLDWDAWLRLAKRRGSFIYVKNRLMIHRLHSDSQTSVQIRSKNRIEEEERIFQSIWGKLMAKLFMQIYKLSSVFSRI